MTSETIHTARGLPGDMRNTASAREDAVTNLRILAVRVIQQAMQDLYARSKETGKPNKAARAHAIEEREEKKRKHAPKSIGEVCGEMAI